MNGDSLERLRENRLWRVADPWRLRQAPASSSPLQTKEFTMNGPAAPVPCAGSQLLESRHVCAFFHDLDEEYRVLLPFIRDGFARGDRAFHVVDPKLREEHLRRLRAAGIDAAQSAPTGSSSCAIGTPPIFRRVISISTVCWLFSKRSSKMERSRDSR